MIHYLIILVTFEGNTHIYISNPANLKLFLKLIANKLQFWPYNTYSSKLLTFRVKFYNFNNPTIILHIAITYNIIDVGNMLRVFRLPCTEK